MLNIGLIGNTENLEPHVKRIQKNRKINIIGKTSVGTNKLNSFHFSIPEFNRIELIERSEIVLIDNSGLLPFNLFCDIVKKSKHIFITEYLDLTIDECEKLVKLSNESGSVIQVTNPYLFHPAVQWLNQNIVKPAFIDITNFTTEWEKRNLHSMLLMLQDLTGTSPKKVGVVSFHSKQKESKFINVRLEFSDASVVNLNISNLEMLNEFKMKIYSLEQFVTFNFSKKNYFCNNQNINLSKITEKEFDSFIHSIETNKKAKSNIEQYLIVLNLIKKINKKIELFSQ
jgi:hypothetical protein